MDGRQVAGNRSDDCTSRYTHSRLLDRHLESRMDSSHGEDDWDGYVADVAAYNAKMLCRALLR